MSFSDSIRYPSRQAESGVGNDINLEVIGK